MIEGNTLEYCGLRTQHNSPIVDPRIFITTNRNFMIYLYPGLCVSFSVPKNQRGGYTIPYSLPKEDTPTNQNNNWIHTFCNSQGENALFEITDSKRIGTLIHRLSIT